MLWQIHPTQIPILDYVHILNLMGSTKRKKIRYHIEEPFKRLFLPVQHSKADTTGLCESFPHAQN